MLLDDLGKFFNAGLGLFYESRSHPMSIDDAFQISLHRMSLFRHDVEKRFRLDEPSESTILRQYVMRWIFNTSLVDG